MKYIAQATTLLVLALLVITGTASAQHSYLEDFTTTTYKGTEYVPGPIWDTDAGEIRFYPFEASLGNVVETPGHAARKIAITGNYAYISDGYYGIQIMDISSPDDPVPVGSFNTPGYTYQVEIDGNFAYVADHSGGLRVLDISNPVQPVEVASLATPNDALGICVKGDFAFMGIGADGMAVIYIVDPLNPQLIGTHAFSGGRNIVVEGDYAFLADGANGLLVLDITNPAGPYPAYTAAGLGTAQDLEVHGNYAYVASSGAGLEIYDITDPTQPTFVAVSAAIGTMRGVTVSGNRAFVANDANGLYLIDISNPIIPILEEIVETPGHAYDAVVVGENAYTVVFGPGLQVVKIAQKVAPAFRGNHDGLTYSGEMSVSGSHAFIPVGHTTVGLIDFSDPENISYQSIMTHSNGVNDVQINGDLALLCNADAGISIYDISNLESPVLLGQVDTPGWAYKAVINGDFAYVAASQSIQVVNISNPASPNLVASFPTSYTVQKIKIDGNLIFAFGNDIAGMDIIDITNPGSPFLRSTLVTSDSIQDIEVQGDLLYAAIAGIGLRIIDITDPSSPSIISTFVIEDFATSIEVVGKTAYLASRESYNQGYLTELDVSNPASPTLVDKYDSTPYSFLHQWGEMLLAVSTNPYTFDVLQIFQHEVDITRNLMLSSSINLPSDPMVRVRANSVTDGAVDWGLIVGNVIISTGDPENSWQLATNPDSNLHWSARLKYHPGTFSAVSQLKIEWLYDHPLIESIVDVPNDQGRQVRLEWTRSGHDFVGDDSQIVEYAIYREIDDELAKSAIEEKDLSNASDALMENIQVMSAAGWDYLTTLPVLVEDRYALVVPTLADSTLADGAYHTTFKVVALTATPGVYFTSYPDSGSSLDNLAPGVPGAITVLYGQDQVDLTWDEATEEDFQYFSIYRGTNPNFIPGSGNLLQQVTSPAWVDAVDSPSQYYYKITAVDFSGNESAPGAALHTSDALPSGPVFALHGAVPNPFNPSTRINYSLAEGGRVQLTIYDVAGRLVRTLVDDVLSAGEHQVRWDGRNQAGKTMASGAYFSLLRSGELVQRRQMLLMK